jgi:hypothetical protein
MHPIKELLEYYENDEHYSYPLDPAINIAYKIYDAIKDIKPDLDLDAMGGIAMYYDKGIKSIWVSCHNNGGASLVYYNDRNGPPIASEVFSNVNQILDFLNKDD